MSVVLNKVGFTVTFNVAKLSQPDTELTKDAVCDSVVVNVKPFQSNGTSVSHTVVSVVENKVLFTGTHDNDTLVGWYEKELKDTYRDSKINFQSDELRQIIDNNSKNIHLEIIRYCMETEYPLVIVPLQDLIGLESDCRMNEPGTLNESNWSWKYNLDDLNDSLVHTMKSITHNSGRA